MKRNIFRRPNYYVISIFLILIICGCKKSCREINTNFSSYKEAKIAVKTLSFEIEESISTRKSNWIRNASFRSCDKRTGFLIIQTDKKEFIHESVPISIWEDFKDARSYGTFYTSKIKGRYRLNLK